MGSPLFADAMELESMFSPPLFVKTDDLAAASTGFFEASSREQSETNLSSQKLAMSQFTFPSVNDDTSEAFPLSLSGDMEMPIPTCFPPSATLMSTEGLSSPQIDLSNGWDPTMSEEISPILQDNANDIWSQPFSNLASDTSAGHQRRYGQLTPPDDRSPKTEEASENFKQGASESSIAEKSTKRGSNANSASTRRRSRPSSSKQEAPASTTKRSRKGRRPTKAASNAGEPEEDVKRERFLERNRVAASKCRQKKKEWTESLEDDERQQKALNSYLTRYVTQLKEELLFLKSECLKHGDCDCVAIREHMRNTIPFMVRPSLPLYDNRPFQHGDNRSSMSSISDVTGSLSATSSRPRSTGSSRSGKRAIEDDDMHSLLSASLTQDVAE